MRELLNRTWKDPVWSKVIAVAIVAIAGVVGGYLLGWKLLVFDWFAKILGWLGQTTQTYNWLLMCLAISVLLNVLIVVAIVLDGVGSSEISQTEYRSDVFFELLWQWRNSSDWRVLSLVPLCRFCKYQINPSATYDRYERRVFDYYCDVCSRNWRIDESPEITNDKVERLIHKRFRTGEWLEVVTKQRADQGHRESS